MEHRIGHHPLQKRPVIQWPDSARVAFWICPNVMFYEYMPPPNALRDPWPRTPHPDVRSYGHQDFGNRIGFWRMLDVLDRYPIRPTCSINVATLEHFPEMRDAMIERDWDYMTHGVYNTRFIYDAKESEERAFYADVRETLYRHTSKWPKGALGPGPQSCTPITPDLLAEAGYVYTGDWHHDDQPYPIKTDRGRLISMPYSQGIGDSTFLRMGWEADDYAEVVRRQFDQLYEEGSETGQVMCLGLHAYLIAQPHRIRYLDKILEYVFSHDNVWAASAAEIADYYLERYYDQVCQSMH